MNNRTQIEIDKITNRLLKETGANSPPFHIEPLMEHLDIFRDYYNLQDPNILQEIRHHIQVGGKKLISIARKIKLLGLWLPDQKAIYIDSSTPKIKHKWISFHEASHRAIPWHKDFFLGDTAQTLEPSFQEQLESEANYAAASLMFGGDLFKKEALDTIPEWESIEALKRRYDATYVTTLYHYIQRTHDLPMAMITSTPWWMEIPGDQETRLRRFASSMLFQKNFSKFIPENILPEIESNARQKRMGLVGEFGCFIEDTNGDQNEFSVQIFFNHYYLITMFVHQGKQTSTRIIF